MAGTNAPRLSDRAASRGWSQAKRFTRRRSRSADGCLYLIAAALLALMVLPYVYLFAQSLAPWNQIDRALFPSSLTLRSYQWLLSGGETGNPQPWGRAFLNSLAVTVTSTFAQVTIGAAVGYGIAILRFRGARLVNNLVMFHMFYPGIILLVPTFLLVQWMGLYNTFWAMFLPTTVSLFAIFMFTSFFQTIPVEVVEAARLDGAGDLTILCSVVIPMARSITTVVALFLFVDRWTALLWDLLVIKDPEQQTLNVLITTMFGPYGGHPGPLYASGVMLTLPLIVLFLVFSKNFVEGVRFVVR